MYDIQAQNNTFTTKKKEKKITEKIWFQVTKNKSLTETQPTQKMYICVYCTRQIKIK